MSINSIIERIFAGRWLAGARIQDAIRVAKQFNKAGVSASINYLGETLNQKAQVDYTVKTYIALIHAVRKGRVNASISLKPSQLGIRIDRRIAEDNYARIVNLARRNGIFVWLDMEEHDYVDPTISLYKTQLGAGMVGICIQSYLKRSQADVEKLIKLGAVIRLVKGAYHENPEIAYTSREETTKNYLHLMEYLFRHADRFMIATHDPEMINHALELNRSYRREVIYAMLNGVRNRSLVRLAGMGNKSAVYIPFGERWLAYTLRRLRERSNLLLILRSLFENQHF